MGLLWEFPHLPSGNLGPGWPGPVSEPRVDVGAGGPFSGVLSGGGATGSTRTSVRPDRPLPGWLWPRPARPAALRTTLVR